jgi:hypothetical protein
MSLHSARDGLLFLFFGQAIQKSLVTQKLDVEKLVPTTRVAIFLGG